MSELKTINKVILMDAAGGDSGMAADLIRLYLELAAKELVLLEDAVTRGDAPAVQAIAHHGAGSCMICGMSEMTALMKNLEYESSLGFLDDSQKRVKQIKEEFSAIQTESILLLESLSAP